MAGTSAASEHISLRRNVRGMFRSAQCIVPLHLLRFIGAITSAKGGQDDSSVNKSRLHNATCTDLCS